MCAQVISLRPVTGMEGEQDMKKRVLAIFMALVLAAGLTGCSSNNASETTSSKQEETTKQAQSEGKDETTAVTTAASGEALELSITWWGSQTRADLTQEALTLYESLNPGVTFDGQFLSGADYWNKLATSAAGHTMADVIQMDKAYIQ